MTYRIYLEAEEIMYLYNTSIGSTPPVDHLQPIKARRMPQAATVPDLSDIARANRTGAALQKVSLPAPRPLFHQESAAKAGAIASPAAAATAASAAAATVVSSASASVPPPAETTRSDCRLMHWPPPEGCPRKRWR